MFKEQKNHEYLPIVKAQEFIEKHYAEKITVVKLANKFGIASECLNADLKKRQPMR